MYNNILVPVDPGHGEVGPRIIAVAKLLAGRDGKITLLTVLEPVPGFVVTHIPEGTIEANRTSALNDLKAMARTAGLDENCAELATGAPSMTIVEVAKRMGADAVILGSHRPQFSDYLIGSTAARVVRHAGCTVIVERSRTLTS